VSKNLATLPVGKASHKAGGVASEADVLRRTLDEAFGTLADVLAAFDSGTLGDLISSVDRVRAEIGAGISADVFSLHAGSCLEATRNIAAHARNRSADQRTQIASLVATVRETVAMIAGDQATLNETLAGSAGRFERLATLTDLQQIQAQLAQEVATLKRITIERREAWEKKFKDFGARLSNLETQLDRTRREAAVDPLTNVANRRTFEQKCREWLKPNRPGFVMAMIDVDDFKAINDRHGHAVGDRVLVVVAETLVRQLRADDVVARLGGDEFVIMAACLTLTQAESRFAAIGRAVQNACRELVPDGTVPSISIGVAECSAGDTLESLQLRADEALYQAKKNGKGRLATKASPFIRDLRKDR
jgi:diguanylate cyclase (GGDEF)-like protein